MSHDDHDHHELMIPESYEGEFEFSNGKFAMWLFLISDAMAFIGFLGAYMVLRMSTADGTAPTPEDLTLPWKPDWAPELDLVATGLNTFVLIISSVTMVKALAGFQDGMINRGKMFLLATIAGGSFFVGFQVWEWNHLIHAGVTMSGLEIPEFDNDDPHHPGAVQRAAANNPSRTRLSIARELYGGRDTSGWDADKLASFSMKEYVNLPIEYIDADAEDFRPKVPGVIHLSSYSIPAKAVIEGGEKIIKGPTVNRSFNAAGTLDEQRRLAAEEGDRSTAIEKHREAGARVANLFSATFYLLTGFHGLHVLIGVLYLWVIFFRARKGAYGPAENSEVEIVGLYWHFVDLVWVLLFMFIYLL